MRTLSGLTYRECAPVVTAEAMRFLDGDTKRSRVSTSGFSPFWDPQAGIESTNINEFETAIDAGYGLMKLAGRKLFEKALSMLGENYESKSVAVFVGGGNNGGDGLVLAKLLIGAGVPCTVYSLAKAETFKNEAAMAYKDFSESGGKLIYINDLPVHDPKFALVVDCMLGNGGSGELRPAFARVVINLNDWNIPILAADSPTGFDSSEHRCGENCIHATETLVFGLPRLDAYTNEGARVFGKTTVEPLDYPDSQIDKIVSGVFLATESIIPALLPDRNEFGDKRSQGTAMVIAGSGNMTGAAALCTKAVLRSGAGLVTTATPKALLPALQSKLDEPVFYGIGDATTDKLSIMHLMQLQDIAMHQNAIAIGPGLGTDRNARCRSHVLDRITDSRGCRRRRNQRLRLCILLHGRRSCERDYHAAQARMGTQFRPVAVKRMFLSGILAAVCHTVQDYHSAEGLPHLRGNS